jgi:hypothetical protein
MSSGINAKGIERAQRLVGKQGVHGAKKKD